MRVPRRARRRIAQPSFVLALCIVSISCVSDSKIPVFYLGEIPEERAGEDAVSLPDGLEETADLSDPAVETSPDIDFFELPEEDRLTSDSVIDLDLTENLESIELGDEISSAVEKIEDIMQDEAAKEESLVAESTLTETEKQEYGAGVSKTNRAERIPQLAPLEVPTENATNNPNTLQKDTRVASVPRDVQAESLERRSTSEVLVVRVDQEFSIVIQAIGWIFVSSTGIPVQFLRSLPQTQSTTFFFLAQETGSTRLVFERYDLGSGDTFFHTAQVTIVDDDTLSETTGTTANISESVDTVPEASGELSYKTTPYDQLAAYLETNPLDSYAVEDLYTRIANDIAQGLIAESLVILRSLLVHDEANLDSVYFYLGQAYEAFSPEQSVERSVSFYELLVSQYPLSEHYENALRRMEFLERNFIQIR